MRRIVLIIILSAFSSPFIAQTSGYMGKRLSVEGSFNIMPEVFKTILGKDRVTYKYESTYYNSQDLVVATDYDNTYLRLEMDFKTDFKINYCLNNKTEVSLGINYIRNTFHFNNYNNSDYYVLANPKVGYNALEYGVNFKFYRNNFIAPVGKFLTVGIGQTKASTQNNETITVSYLGDYNVPQYEETLNKAKFIKFNVGIGNNKIMAGNFYFKYLAELNFYRNRYKLSFPSSENGVRNLFGYNVGRNLAYSNLFNLKIGFGIIL
ncbi:MAG: hypothetical protein N4A35_06150 [Flavobacteriales bacterium]|jgi:hypothetical protein|nr:hypothetical protein [Flavobacteriales bacterium]